MALEVAERCPHCGLRLVSGCIFDLAPWREAHGPILGIDRGVEPASAEVGYVGLGSLFDPVTLRSFYRCPRCHVDVIIEVPDQTFP